jgi:hypothetical protein
MEAAKMLLNLITPSLQDSGVREKPQKRLIRGELLVRESTTTMKNRSVL